MKLPRRKFAHEPVFEQSRSRVKVYCRCGAQSPRLVDLAEAVKAYTTHVGLKEMERKEVLH